MEKEKLAIYFIPGLAASTSIFEYLHLPEEYEIHLLPWLIPLSKDEKMEDYAKRMCESITIKNHVLVGVSFGGMMAQEMSKISKPLQTVLISSVKNHNELPKRFRLIKTLKAYKLAPIKLITNIEKFTIFVYGAKKRGELYKKYLSMRDEIYLPWAIKNVLHWKQSTPDANIIHIHGNADGVFPIKHIKNCIVIEGGTHIMILNKAKKISAILTEKLDYLIN